MKKYTVHFSGYYGYNVDVDANNEEEALEKASDIFDEVDPNEFVFECSQPDVMEREGW